MIEIANFVKYIHVHYEEATAEKSTVTLQMEDMHRNVKGYVHGGVFLTLADCATGIIARNDGKNWVTQSLNLNFLSNVKSGEITANAEVIHRGRHTMVLHVRIRQGEKLLCDGDANYYLIGE